MDDVTKMAWADYQVRVRNGVRKTRQIAGEEGAYTNIERVIVNKDDAREFELDAPQCLMWGIPVAIGQAELGRGCFTFVTADLMVHFDALDHMTTVLPSDVPLHRDEGGIWKTANQELEAEKARKEQQEAFDKQMRERITESGYAFARMFIETKLDEAPSTIRAKILSGLLEDIDQEIDVRNALPEDHPIQKQPPGNTDLARRLLKEEALKDAGLMDEDGSVVQPSVMPPPLHGLLGHGGSRPAAGVIPLSPIFPSDRPQSFTDMQLAAEGARRVAESFGVPVSMIGQNPPDRIEQPLGTTIDNYGLRPRSSRERLPDSRDGWDGNEITYIQRDNPYDRSIREDRERYIQTMEQLINQRKRRLDGH